MDLAAFSAAQFWAFLQIFARVSALFVSAPVFGAREIPAMVKVGLSAILSLVLLPLVRRHAGTRLCRVRCTRWSATWSGRC